MKLKKITIIMWLILILQLNIKALTEDLDCGSNTNFHINSDVICKLFVNPEGSLISSFKADITYPNDITLFGIQSSWINSSTNNRIDMKMQTSTGNEGITNKTEIATLKFKTTTSYGDKQIKLSGGDLGQTVSIKEIHVISDNNKLKSLNVIGENIKFDKNIEEYVLKTNKDSIDIKAELDDTNARYEQNLGPRKVSLNYGEQSINIVVIAENNEKKTYTLKVTRQDNRSTNDNLSNIVVSFGELSPKFSKDVLNYTLEVPNNVESLTVTPTLEDKKAEDITIIDISEVSVLADYFIIADGSNRNQVQAMADSAEEALGKAGYDAKQIEGYQSANWILMDYKDIIVHVFSKEDRAFYDLERIWRDGKQITKEDLQ